MGFTGEAIELFNDVREKLKKAIVDKGANPLKSLRTRARNTPSMIMTSGLTQTLAFLASKSNGELYSILYRGETKQSKAKEEEAGYTAYLYVIMRFLGKNKLLTEEPESLEKVIKAIKQLDENPHQALVVQNILMEFLLEFKKITEALIE